MPFVDNKYRYSETNTFCNLRQIQFSIWDKYSLQFETNTVCNLRQIQFAIWDKYTDQMRMLGCRLLTCSLCPFDGVVFDGVDTFEGVVAQIWKDQNLKQVSPQLFFQLQEQGLEEWGRNYIMPWYTEKK